MLAEELGEFGACIRGEAVIETGAEEGLAALGAVLEARRRAAHGGGLMRAAVVGEIGSPPRPGESGGARARRGRGARRGGRRAAQPDRDPRRVGQLRPEAGAALRARPGGRRAGRGVGSGWRRAHACASSRRRWRASAGMERSPSWPRSRRTRSWSFPTPWTTPMRQRSASSGITAALALDRATLEGGERVLVLAATGAVGQAALQLARRAARAGSLRRAGAVRAWPGAELGADAAVSLEGEGLADEFKEAAGGDLDVVVDPLWGEPRWRRSRCSPTTAGWSTWGSAAWQMSGCRSTRCATGRARSTRSRRAGRRAGEGGRLPLAARRRDRRAARDRSRRRCRWTTCAGAWERQADSPHRKLVIQVDSSLTCRRGEARRPAPATAEDARILSGQSRFLDDIDPEGALHAGVRAQPARDTRASPGSRCRSAAGGRRGPDRGGPREATLARSRSSCRRAPGGRTSRTRSSRPDEVRYVGQPVAAVLAETRALAEDAAELVEVEYEPLDAVVDPYSATQELLRFERAGGRRGRSLRRRRRGGARALLDAAARGRADGDARGDRVERSGRGRADDLVLRAGHASPAAQPRARPRAAGRVDPGGGAGRGRRLRLEGRAGGRGGCGRGRRALSEFHVSIATTRRPTRQCFSRMAEAASIRRCSRRSQMICRAGSSSSTRIFTVMTALGARLALPGSERPSIVESSSPRPIRWRSIRPPGPRPK